MPPVEQPLRIGVLGAARIVRTALVAPAARSSVGSHATSATVTALASRSMKRGASLAHRLHIPVVHDSYDALLDDNSIDAVYIATPAAHHARWTLAAIAAGRHVLVEKPLTSTVADAESLVDSTRPGIIVMEAYHTHYHPQRARIRQILASGELGRVTHARAVFAVPIPPGDDIRWNPALGGGSLLDIGYYPVRLLRDLFGDFDVMSADARWLRGVDRRIDATVRFDDGITAEIVSSMWSHRMSSASLKIIGERGRLLADRPYHAGGTIRVMTADGRRVERMSREPSYDFQLAAFCDAVHGNAPVQTDIVTGAAQIQALHTLMAHARQNG